MNGIRPLPADHPSLTAAATRLRRILTAWAFANSPIPLQSARILLVQTASVALLAIGLGLGAAFSPTQRRVAALAAIGLGSIEYLLAILFGKTLLG